MSMFVCLSHSCLSTSIFSKSHVQSASNLLCMLPTVPDYKRRVECMAEFRTRLYRRQAIGTSLQKTWKSHSIPISTQIRLMKALVWIPDNSRLSPTENGKSNHVQSNRPNHTATPDTTRLSRLPVDRRRRDAEHVHIIIDLLTKRI